MKRVFLFIGRSLLNWRRYFPSDFCREVVTNENLFFVWDRVNSLRDVKAEAHACLFSENYNKLLALKMLEYLSYCLSYLQKFSYSSDLNFLHGLLIK